MESPKAEGLQCRVMQAIQIWQVLAYVVLDWQHLHSSTEAPEEEGLQGRPMQVVQIRHVVA
jgi:hypothetical protein